MTKYEACCKLKEWGCPQEGTGLVYPDGYIPPNGIWNEEAYDDGILVPLLEPLLSFAESLREKVHDPKLGKIWCPTCDRYRVAPGQKCPVCGTRLLPKRRKP